MKKNGAVIKLTEYVYPIASLRFRIFFDRMFLITWLFTRNESHVWCIGIARSNGFQRQAMLRRGHYYHELSLTRRT